MPKHKNIVDYYRARAPEYEQIYYRDVPERRREIENHCKYLERIAKDKIVLDLACGTGYWTRIAANSANQVIGGDLAVEMIHQARQKNYCASTNFVACDLYHLPFQSKSFDLVILGFWLSHEPRQNFSRLFEIISDPLNKNGQIWMIDNNLPAEGAQIDSVRIDEDGNNFKLRKLADGTEYVILKNYFTKQELETILANRFQITNLIHEKYYWSALLGQK